MTELRCAECSHWLGESPEALVHIETVSKSTEARVDPPRDLRLCKSCTKVNVFIAVSDLSRARNEVA